MSQADRIDAGTMTQACPICGHEDLWTFAEVHGAPAHVGVLWESRADAMACPKGDIHLGFCVECGFVTNRAFRSELVEYVEGYDNALDFSAVFQQYSRSLVSDLIERYDLRGKRVLEVGCGKGDFLKLLCEAGGNHGVGFDPSYDGPDQVGDVNFVREFYTRDHAHVPANLIVCRQTFEHIGEPRQFLQELAATIGDRPIPVFFEVPDLRHIVRSLSIWDIIYEHCSYFATESLTRVFTDNGFRVIATTPLFSGQFLGLHAELNADAGHEVAAADLGELTRSVTNFARAFDERIRGWRRRFAELADRGGRAVVWGAGARGTSFVNMVIDGGCVRALVDINPRKHGRFIAGTGHKIVAPEELRRIEPELVIVMNPIYMQEIRRELQGLGIDAEVFAA